MALIFHLSDWHTTGEGFRGQLDYNLRYQKLSEPDLVLLTGDMVRNFNPSLRDFGNEEAMQAQHYGQMVDYIDFIWPGVDIFGVRGNHDWCDYTMNGAYAFDNLNGGSFLWKDMKISGFRGVTPYGNWKDQYSERQLGMLCDLVDRDTDILLTHIPPVGILDDAHDVMCYRCGNKVNQHGVCIQGHLPEPGMEIRPHNIGSFSVRDLVDKLPKLKLHCFGHAHEPGGRVEVRDGKVFSNAACALNVIEL